MEKIKNITKKAILYLMLTAILFILIFAVSLNIKGAKAESAKDFPPTTLSVRYGKTKNGSVYRAELTAVYENKGLFAQNITINLYYPETGEKTVITPAQNAGYSPAIVLADFTGDGAEEIFLGITSGGSGGYGYYYIYEPDQNSVNILFDYEKLGNPYRAEYADCYKVTVTDQTLGEIYNIDISDRGEDYLSALYDENGKLLNPVPADVSAVNSVLPFFDNNKSRFNLLVLRRITGLYSADSFGYTQNFMSYSENGFTAYYNNVAIN